MYIHQARELRRHWENEENAYCKHETVTGERAVTGYMTGMVVCVICGKEMISEQPMSQNDPDKTT